MNSLNNKGTRIEYFDYAKGVLIILILFGHLTSEQLWWRKAIFAFALPAFFMITGMLIGAFGNKKDFLIKNIKGIAWPYLTFSLLYIGKVYYESGFQFEIVRQAIERQMCFWKGTMWFLPSLFFAKTITQTFIKYVTQKIVYVISIPVMIICLSCTSNIIQYNEVFTNIMYTDKWYVINFFNKTFIGAIFVLLGYLLYPF